MSKAAVLPGVMQPLEIRDDVEVEAPHANEVKVRMAASIPGGRSGRPMPCHSPTPRAACAGRTTPPPIQVVRARSG